MNNLEFRKLKKEAIPAFVEMRKLQLLEEGAVPTTDLTKPLTDYFTQALEDGSFVSWIALVDGKMIATSGMSFSRRPPYYGNPSGCVGTLSCMHTLKAFRRQGIATKLLDAVVKEAKQRHCGKVTITASAMGKLLYRSYGFKQKDNYLDYDLTTND
ncbi:GNAT family N-acetyltransferase [Sporolactobacillus sp. STCC-11]|uniref:GNAT family N-acetyltransferase n=1 Tax=Sporolactobacillus caesalpiniae TaxID=3230362 RepID=UPI003399A72D